MTYTPLSIKPQDNITAPVSLMAKKGLNQEGLEEMMNLDFAKKVVNYIPYSYGIGTRKGAEKQAEKAGLTTGPTLFESFTNGDFIVGYGTSIEAWNVDTGTFTVIKSDFSTSTRWGGDRYGDYFFVTNGVDLPRRVSKTLAYDAQTGNFTAGDVITGGTSGATATILEDSDGGATGTLTLGGISGTFANDEIITDPSGGSATVNGTLGFTITSIATAPICDDIKFIGPRAVAISLGTDETAVQVSEVDDASNPPFDGWPVSADADDGAIVNYRNAGKARSCVALGKFFVVFSDDGYFAFTIDQLDVAGTVQKVEVVQDYRTDFGGARGALSTPLGVFYFNEGGLWQLVQVGQTQVPYSRQQRLTSVLLSDEYFDDATSGDADLVYDEKQKLILLTYAQGSDVNNKVLAYKKSEEIEALFEIEGWTLNRFAQYNKKIYACSSVDGKIFECFKGYTDDDLAISCEYTQELPLNTLWAKHSLLEFHNKGFLSIDSTIDVNFDIYDRDGAPIPSKKVNRWTAQRNDNESDGWGTASFGKSSWGGDFDLSSMVESFDGCAPKISNAQRIIVRYVSEVQEPHIINWFRAKIKDKAPIRVRKMEDVTNN